MENGNEQKEIALIEDKPALTPDNINMLSSIIPGFDMDSVLDLIGPAIDTIRGWDNKLSILNSKLDVLIQNQEGIYEELLNIKEGKEDSD